MADEKNFDVRKLIDQSASKSTLKELASKGIHSVKVIDENTINKLIEEAVQRIIVTRTNVLTEQERKKIYEASRRELQRLLQEHSEMKQKSELVEKDKNSMIREVENLQRQVQLTRKMSAEEARMRFEEGIDSQQPLIRELRERVELLERSLQDGAKKDMESDLSRRLLQELHGMSAAIQTNVESKFRLLEEKMTEREQGQQEHMDIETQREELRRKLEDLSQKDDRVASKLETLFNRMSNTLTQKIQGIRLRAMASGDNAYSYTLSDTALDALLREELESNLQAVEAEETEAVKVGESLDKLRAIRQQIKGGGKGA